MQNCGTVNRVTILTDKGGNPKGFAYIEFLEADAVANACLLEGTDLHGRQIKVRGGDCPGSERGGGRVSRGVVGRGWVGVWRDGGQGLQEPGLDGCLEGWWAGVAGAGVGCENAAGTQGQEEDGGCHMPGAPRLQRLHDCEGG